MADLEKTPLTANEAEPATQAQPETTPAAPEAAATRPEWNTKGEVMEALQRLIAENKSVDRAEMESYKQVYYRLHNAQIAAEREAFLAGGGEAEAFLPSADTTEEAFKSLMNQLREQRARLAEEQERQRQENLQRKQAIIDRLKELTASADEANKAYDEVKDLQTAWKETGAVPPEVNTELWKNYQLYVEQFYDLLRINHEMRAYDFKKNQEAKEQIIAQAERLTTEEDVISAFHQLQTLHEQFREIGPVSKEVREDIWKRFKEASTTINKRHQAHFEQIKAQEEENLERKTALCELVEGIQVEELTSFNAWEKQTKIVMDAQAQWRTIGFTPRKMNAQIFERFRAACDRFFTRKSEYYHQQREVQSQNLQAKNALCEQAEALKESTEWSATAAKLVEFQKEWKKIGAVSHKASEAVWKRFNDACNYFFERRAEATSGVREEEEKNLVAKQEVIAELEALLEKGEEGMREAVRALQERWNAIGHVPFRKKEKIYKKYREVCDQIFDQLHVNAGRRHLNNFRTKVAEKAGSELSRERQRLQRILEEKKTEIQNYETNIGFFRSTSKTGNSLVAEIEKKTEKLREELDLLREKIAAVVEKMKEEGKEK